jgi:hypothetical protein
MPPQTCTHTSFMFHIIWYSEQSNTFQQTELMWIKLFITHKFGRAMAHVVGRRPLNSEAWVRAWVSQCGISDEQNDSRTGYCNSSGFSLNIIPPWLSTMKNRTVVRFQVLTAASVMFRVVFWVILPCKMIVDRRFRGAYCLQSFYTAV